MSSVDKLFRFKGTTRLPASNLMKTGKACMKNTFRPGVFRTASAVRMDRDESSSKHARMGVRRSGGALEKRRKSRR